MNLDALVADCRMVVDTENIVNDFINRNTGVLPGVHNTTGTLVSHVRCTAWWLTDKDTEDIGRTTYGTVYCRMVTEIRPAQELRMLVKWSLDNMECVGSVHVGSSHVLYWEAALAPIREEDPSFSIFETC